MNLPPINAIKQWERMPPDCTGRKPARTGPALIGYAEGACIRSILGTMS